MGSVWTYVNTTNEGEVSRSRCLCWVQDGYLMYMRCGRCFRSLRKKLENDVYIPHVRSQGPYRTNVKDLNGNVIGTKVTFNAIIDGRRSITRM
jgi:hypothetical protein